MMEAVSWVAALHIQAEGFSVAVGAALVGVARDTLRIRADKHGVVILGIYAHAFDKNKRKAQEKLGKAIGL